MCVLRHQLCDDSVIHQMRLSRAKQKCALAPGALSRETNYAAYASAAASGHYRLPTVSVESTTGYTFTPGPCVGSFTSPGIAIES